MAKSLGCGKGLLIFKMQEINLSFTQYLLLKVERVIEPTSSRC